MIEITKAEAEKTWAYDKETGMFFRKRCRMKRGAIGTFDKHGYLVLSVNSKKIYAHRLAWLLVYGEMPARDLDHINGIRDDNRICNLRVATVSENRRNTSVRKDSTTGVKGVRKVKDRFQAYIRVNRIRLNLGMFATLGEASFAYESAARQYFGEFACTSRPKHLIAREIVA